MFKKHPITTIINILLFISTIIVLRNSIEIALLILLFIILNNYTNRRIYFNLLKVAALISVFNIICGNLTGLLLIILILIYTFELGKDYTIIDAIKFYDQLFYSSQKNLKLSFIKYLYFKNSFIKNYKKLLYFEKEFGTNSKYKIELLKKTYYMSKQELIDIIKLYEQRLYLNKGRSKYKIKFTKEDLFLIVFHVIILIVTIYFGRGYYALFN